MDYRCARVVRASNGLTRDNMTIFDWIWIAICVVLVSIPANWDPAIRLKERFFPDEEPEVEAWHVPNECHLCSMGKTDECIFYQRQHPNE